MRQGAGDVHFIKSLQAARFRGTYSDFLAHPAYAAATRFFLDELYGEGDFSGRDEQFARIAGAIERLFPPEVGDLAVDLATTHGLTERLDHAMARQLPPQTGTLSDGELVRAYVHAWRQVGEAQSRARQLSVVIHMGQELDRLTRRRSLRMALRLMRGPAKAAGLSELQRFLEAGFDAFSGMRSPQTLLDAIEQRERDWLEALFHAPMDDVTARLEAECRFNDDRSGV
ncbi:hypothetical protein NBRC116584_11620 [Hydrogenophaga sp. 5NK40-0174]